MKITIYTIAEEADTSISTVSRYLNGKNVKASTKARIEEVIAKYNYKPSLIAKALVSHFLKTIAVFVVDIRAPHFASAAYHIDCELAKYGYRTIICNTSSELPSMFKYISDVSNQVDGIIFFGSIFQEVNKSPEVLGSIKNLPIVSINGSIDVLRNRSIYVDEEKGTYDATKYLIEKDCHKIAYIQYSNSAHAKAKTEGYTKALREANLTPAIYYTNNLLDGYNVANKILLDYSNVDAILSGEDLISMGVIRALNDRSIKIGKDCKVIGFDNSDYCNLVSPSLSSVDNKIYQTAILSANSLKDMIEQDSADTSSIHLNCELSLKESA